MWLSAKLEVYEWGKTAGQQSIWYQQKSQHTSHSLLTPVVTCIWYLQTDKKPRCRIQLAAGRKQKLPDLSRWQAESQSSNRILNIAKD